MNCTHIEHMGNIGQNETLDQLQNVYTMHTKDNLKNKYKIVSTFRDDEI